ncbi:autophagy-related protein 11 [Podospora aff. communis PSN243]|uniref:Autophagy-related protein 11 n=1 Tax=Podospora aff. communis PSN243 TaxID=3040156 RepID=A0AAV9GRW1_9PEZI|nr:autophagy-related protein 11 [Podospora aff. communis PSN243]
MAAQVLIAHSGQRLQIDASQLTSLDDFKSTVAQQSGIPVQCIITLTPQGKPLKLQTIQTEKEIYVYDNRLTQVSMASTPIKPELPIPKRYNPSTPPNSIEDTRSVTSWQELFKARRAWTLKVLEDCGQMAAAAHERLGEMDVMLRCLDAAVTNLESVVKGLEPKYAELKKWASPAQAEYSALTTGWEQYLSLARSIPISLAMMRFMTSGDAGGGKGRPQRQATLEDLVDLEAAKRTGRFAPSALRKFTGRIADLDKAATRLFQSAENLFHEFERMVARSALSHDGESAQLLQDIEAVAQKIDTDCQTTLDFSNSSLDVLQASKIAAGHTERLLPSIRKRALEMDEMLRYATQSRNKLAAESVEIMRSITELTALSHSVKSQISIFPQEDELSTFDYLRLIQQLPYMYACFVAEAIQRREWFEKVRQDSSTLANEMALFQDEEIKRRRRWHKSVGDAYLPIHAAESKVPGLELNLLGEEDQWPAMTKADLDGFYELLRNQKAEPQLVADIGRLITEISSPTKQQARRMKAFKNGSVHEAALGRSGLLIRGDDDLLRSIQEDKSKLESKLKTAESRVRRLEDLLHRQTQASRPSIGSLFQMPSQQLSDRNDSTVSVKSPRPDDRRGSMESADGLVQRLQQLEAELQAEKERSAQLEKDLGEQTALYNDTKGQIEEVNSTKKDLMENMEALKREFVDERKSFEEEIKQLQARLDTTEDEMEQFGESRENEKTSHTEKIRALELEVERLTKENQDCALKAEGQVEFLRKEVRLQRELIHSQELQLQEAQDEAKSLAKKVTSLTERADKQLDALKGLWEQSSQDDAPGDLADLVEGISSRLADALKKARNHEGDMSLLRMELDAAQNTGGVLRGELTAAREKLSEHEMFSMRLRDAVAEERARVAVLEGELADGREQLRQLRAKIADGETGSESLRKKLEEDERLLASTTEQLASRQSQVGRLEEEARHFEQKLQESQTKLSVLNLRLDSRSEHAKDLTRRLYLQNERLSRLLERVGFSVTRQGDTMVIQKIPRSERSKQNADDSDPGSSIRRSGTLSRSTLDTADLELLNWMDNADAAAEQARYDAYMAALGAFDVDMFSEAIFKRMKDVEHMARRYQRDYKVYREKAHTLQKEANEKIAYRYFKEGDLALFLPTRNQTTGAWAAFNVGFPHYFLREQETHRLHSKEWVVARISRIQERVVDLSKSLQHQATAVRNNTPADTEFPNDDENDNPFDLSDGLRWYLVDAVEYKPGAPPTPGLAKTTVGINNIEAVGDMRSVTKGPLGRIGAASGIESVSKTLSKSLQSRRSSTGSKKALPFTIGGARGPDSAVASETNSLRAVATDTPTGASPVQQQISPPQAPEQNPSQVTDPARPPAYFAIAAEASTVYDSLVGP